MCVSVHVCVHVCVFTWMHKKCVVCNMWLIYTFNLLQYRICTHTGHGTAKTCSEETGNLVAGQIRLEISKLYSWTSGWSQNPTSRKRGLAGSILNGSRPKLAHWSGSGGRSVKMGIISVCTLLWGGACCLGQQPMGNVPQPLKGRGQQDG